MLDIITTVFNVSGSIDIVIDNASVLQIKSDTHSIYNVTSATRTDIDLIAEIEALQDKIPTTLRYRWEKSHPKKTTTLWQHLNDGADTLAETAHSLSHPWEPTTISPLLPAARLSCITVDGSTTGRLITSLHNTLQEASTLRCVQAKYDWLSVEVNDID